MLFIPSLAFAELIGTGNNFIGITGGPFLLINSPVDFYWGTGDLNQQLLSTTLYGTEAGNVYHFDKDSAYFGGVANWFESIHDHPEISIPINEQLRESHGWYWNTGEYVLGTGPGMWNAFWKPGSENYVVDAIDFTIIDVGVSPQLFGINFKVEIYGSPAPAPVPEPTTMLLLGLGLVGLTGVRRNFN